MRLKEGRYHQMTSLWKEKVHPYRHLISLVLRCSYPYDAWMGNIQGFAVVTRVSPHPPATCDSVFGADFWLETTCGHMLFLTVPLCCLIYSKHFKVCGFSIY
jgi:hypothetical protein